MPGLWLMVRVSNFGFRVRSPGFDHTLHDERDEGARVRRDVELLQFFERLYG